jgi:MerR family transcriptional regulator, light-induced transcriptional regulator
VRLMASHIADGVAAREAAALATTTTVEPVAAADSATGTGGAAFDARAAREQLLRAVEGFDEPAAQAVMDELLSAATIDAVLSEVVMPFLHEVGDRWERGELSVAQEHFASHVLRGRLLGLARGWGGGIGPLALLACPSGERHDLGLISFGLALRTHGWRIAFIGSDTPIDSIVRATEMVQPALLVISVTTPDLLEPIDDELEELARTRTVAVAGAGATALPEGTLGLPGDPVGEAARASSLAG